MQISSALKKKFKEANSVCVLTGAGISAESGIPTFRGGGKSAVWKGMPFDEISSATMVKENLPEVWEWFDYRRGVLQKSEPNPAHFALAEWEKHFEKFTLITQNVDGLHTRAGSENIVEVHGNINRSRCVSCEEKFQMKAEDVPHKPANCKNCGGNVRPDVVLFGEMLPFGSYEKAASMASECDLFFVIGTSALVYPAAMLPEVAKQNGAYLVEVNPEKSSLSDYCDEKLSGKAGEILPLFLNQNL
ncbi:MAG: NAD-dependent deacylase [Acidobacteriota bacterium]|nr:NAD-dependent deacylase [Acidobacteriota bacterium]